MTSRLHRDGGFCIATLATIALAAAGLAGCKPDAGGGNAVAIATPAANPCGQFAPTQTSALPGQIGNDQTQVDCSAWAIAERSIMMSFEVRLSALIAGRFACHMPLRGALSPNTMLASR